MYRPIRRLRIFSNSIDRQDIVLARVGRGLEGRIKREGEEQGLVAQVKYWAGAWEVEEMFPTL